jgi:hypothetical protein
VSFPRSIARGASKWVHQQEKSMAAVDITVAQAELVGQIASVVSVGIAVLLVYVALSAYRAMRTILEIDGAVGGGGTVDHWEGYTADDDARDRAAAGLDAVYARAAAMAAAGEGQSEDFKHNTVTAAYDAGYSGRRLGDSADPATLAAWQEGNDARREDEIRYGDR